FLPICHNVLRLLAHPVTSYTTLFRSLDAQPPGYPVQALPLFHLDGAPHGLSVPVPGLILVQLSHGGTSLLRSARLQPALCCPLGDRKSTRLNSSHVKITYAVFCLKKK